MNKYRLFLRLAPSTAWAYCTWMVRYSRHPERYPIEVRYAKVRKFMLHCIKLWKADLVVDGGEYITNRTEPFLGVSNHRHFLDPILYIYLSKQPVSFIAKKEAYKLPLVGRVIRSLSGYFIDRDDIMSQVRVFKEIAQKMKNEKICYYIFPEGTRQKDKNCYRTLPYKDGALKLAYWANVDIIPSVSYGLELAFKPLPKGVKNPKVNLHVFKPITPEDYKDKPTTEVMPKIYNMTNEILPRLAKENKDYSKK